METKTKHTQGEWAYAYGKIFSKKSGRRIAELKSSIPPEEQDANGFLIVSAPIMLSALKEAQEIIEQETGHKCFAVELAISEAEGDQ